MNLGILKENAFSHLLNSYKEGKKSNGKEFFKEFIKEINNEKSLKKAFLAINTIEKTKFKNYKSAEDFLVETLALMRDSNSSKHLSKLNKVFEKYGLKINSDVPRKKLYDNIELLANLHNTSKTPNNVKNAHKAKEYLVEYLLEAEKVEPVVKNYDFNGVPVNLLSRVAVDKYNNKWNNKLGESEIKVVKAVLSNNTETKETLFKELVENNVELVRDMIAEADESDKELYQKLRQTEKKLYKMRFVEDTFLDDASKLLELNESLNGEQKE